jgi:hypothetical protein
MINFFKRFFKINSDIGKGATFDVSNCDFLKMSKEEQEERLILDGHYTRSKEFTFDSNIVPDDFVPEEYKKSSLPLEVDIEIKFKVDFNNLKDVFSPDEEVVIKTFEHLEGNLKNIVNSFMFQDQNDLNKHLSGKEESSKKLETREFMKSIFQTFDVDELFLQNRYHYLPKGVDQTNLLSKVYLVELHLKKSLLSQNIDLIKMYLYCPDLLKSKTIHIDFPNVSRLVEFCARRNLMIELNKKHQFEQNHPYTFIHSRGLVFENHTDLFENETDFNWMLDQLLDQDKKLSPKFCNRLTKALDDEGSFQEKSKFNIFCTFLNQNFDTKLTKVRPDEAADSEIGKQEVEDLKRDLRLYRNTKN